MVKKYGSIEEAADYLSVSQRTIRRLIAAGVVSAIRVGPRLLRVDMEQLATVAGSSDVNDSPNVA